MLELPSNFTATAGYKTHYVESGSGAPLILIHGGGAGADGLGNWQHCIPYLSQNFRVIAYDLVGFGKSDAPAVGTFRYDRESRVEQAIALIEALGLASANIIGNSMGSVVALGVAMQRPDLLNKIVLMSSAGLNHHVPPAIAASASYDFSMEAMRRIVRGLTRPEFEIDEDLIKYRFDLLEGKADKKAAYLETMRVVIETRGIGYQEDEIAAVTTEALVFHGRDDKVIPVSEALRQMELLREAHAYLVPHCGHWAMIEQPEILARISRSFLLGD